MEHLGNTGVRNKAPWPSGQQVFAEAALTLLSTLVSRHVQHSGADWATAFQNHRTVSSQTLQVLIEEKHEAYEVSVMYCAGGRHGARVEISLVRLGCLAHLGATGASEHFPSIRKGAQ